MTTAMTAEVPQTSSPIQKQRYDMASTTGASMYSCGGGGRCVCVWGVKGGVVVGGGVAGRQGGSVQAGERAARGGKGGAACGARLIVDEARHGDGGPSEHDAEDQAEPEHLRDHAGELPADLARVPHVLAVEEHPRGRVGGVGVADDVAHPSEEDNG